ncbi:transferrin-binding protein-like solute binding protein [Cognatishimia activa]|uniref:transferrin-binding protein-like solute binding protein n=1 Tax=Cognatishimia activa TaxID=1715691 RepID=UPI00223259BA|nr:transferrin-binding protein-like solute binding protein [Cognatishimia activa]UZD91173.1 transferrin-binding protein-like solute binding protein [Cognatishimia activa]
MKAKFTIAMLAASTLSACVAGVASSPTTSRISSVSGGTVNESLSSEQNGSVSAAGVGTVAYVTGVDRDRGQMVAAAGISGTPSVGTARTSGSGTYSTNYRYGVIDNVSRTSTTISGVQGSETGSMSLAADFDAGTLTGSNSELTVNGTISGSTVGGSVTATYSYSTLRGSINGNLAGSIGRDGVIGTFHGSDSNTVMAGGLVGTAD